jgi:hypothetical protein
MPLKIKGHARVERLALALNAATDNHVKIVFVDQDYPCERPATVVRKHGSEKKVLELLKGDRRLCNITQALVAECSIT